MLILRGPGGFTGGKASDALVSHIDLFPTVCDLAGVERPEWLQGESLLPLANGEADEVRDAIFAEKTYHVAYEPERCVRTHRWKYIRRFGERTRPVLPNTDDGPSKELLLSYGWGEREIPPSNSTIWSWIPTRRTTSPKIPLTRGRWRNCVKDSRFGWSKPKTRSSTGT
jgi:hypothetical protein